MGVQGFRFARPQGWGSKGPGALFVGSPRPCEGRNHGSGEGPWVVFAASGKPRNCWFGWKGEGKRKPERLGWDRTSIFGRFIKAPAARVFHPASNAFKLCVARLLSRELGCRAFVSLHPMERCTWLFRALPCGARGAPLDEQAIEAVNLQFPDVKGHVVALGSRRARTLKILHRKPAVGECPSLEILVLSSH